jgi:hypothetical protein
MFCLLAFYFLSFLSAYPSAAFPPFCQIDLNLNIGNPPALLEPMAVMQNSKVLTAVKDEAEPMLLRRSFIERPCNVCSALVSYLTLSYDGRKYSTAAVAGCR